MCLNTLSGLQFGCVSFDWFRCVSLFGFLFHFDLGICWYVFVPIMQFTYLGLIQLSIMIQLWCVCDGYDFFDIDIDAILKMLFVGVVFVYWFSLCKRWWTMPCVKVWDTFVYWEFKILFTCAWCMKTLNYNTIKDLCIVKTVHVTVVV